MIPVEMWREPKRIFFKFDFSNALRLEIKAMQGSHYHGYDEVNPRKLWSVADSQRNKFQLQYLMGGNPYAHYDKPLVEVSTDRSAYNHQIEIASFEITRRRCIVAAEMATGKTLSTILAMEASGIGTWWWVGPKWALLSVQREFRKWKSKIYPQFFTYEAVVKMLKQGNFLLPEGLVLDEASKVKNPQAIRSQACREIADLMRDKFPDPMIILLSGAPAPKSPVDWWNLCEIACPGFLKEGDVNKFKQRLAIISKEESISGATFQKIVAWKDSTDRCAWTNKDEQCGKLKSEHDLIMSHIFVPGENEVHNLYKRMSGLVIVKRKKFCLDLPEKQYRIIRCKPNAETLRAHKLIKSTSRTTIDALTRSRELSDGFQYKEVESGTGPCSLCSGSGKISGQLVGATEPVECTNCGGKGVSPTFRRETVNFACPKDAILTELLEEHEDVGRFVVFAGFTGAIDKITAHCLNLKWSVVRLDQGKMSLITKDPSVTGDPLDVFCGDKHDRVCFVSHPGSGGMGLNLQVSPTCLFYSNDFNADYRIQAEDRIHRPGMDYNRGATIVDLFHLETDEYVYNNLKVKRDLQSISLGELQTWSSQILTEQPS